VANELWKLGISFDWISPLIAIAGDIANGRNTRTFLIPANCGWTGREIERLLNRNGITTWGLMIINETFTISVRQSQAEWAQYVLERAGIPMENQQAY